MAQLKNRKTAANATNRQSQWSILVDPLADFLTARTHSPDFTATRGRLIRDRIAPLALILAIGIPLWIPLEFLLFEQAQFALLAGVRVVVGAAVLVLYLILRHLRQLPPAHRVRWHIPLALLLFAPGVLYAAARLPGDMSDTQLLNSGYAFFPIVMVMVLAIFPLTLRELVVACSLIIGGLLVVEVVAGTLTAPLALQLIWIILLTAAICAWASANHLRTLLQLYRQATRDLLTGLLNRRALAEQLEREQRRAERYARPLTLLMMDLDRFKRLNDEYGHLTGDHVLQEFAQRAGDILRDSDVLGRWGGEEFVAGLVETPREGAEQVAERIRAACENAPVTADDGREVHFTLSIGVDAVRKGETLEDAIRRVDDALYEAKRQGRNRVTVAG